MTLTNRTKDILTTIFLAVFIIVTAIALTLSLYVIYSALEGDRKSVV